MLSHTAHIHSATVGALVASALWLECGAATTGMGYPVEQRRSFINKPDTHPGLASGGTN